MSKENMTKEDWMQGSVNSVVEKMQFQMGVIGKSKEDAIKSVREQTTAGSKAWELALAQIS